MRKDEFEYDNRKFEVRAENSDTRWNVQVYEENGKPASRVKYSVDHLTIIDAAPFDLVAELMRLAKLDFIQWSDWVRREAAKQGGSSN